LDWLTDGNAEKLSLWATFHPTETDRATFVDKIRWLRERNIRLSAGVVGVPEFLSEIQQLRRELPDDMYLWINPQQPRRRPYTAGEQAAFESIDPQFSLLSRRSPSLGKACSTGETSFTVDGRGNMRRCHFVDEVIGNVYSPDWETTLQSRVCPRRACDCYLGKAQFLTDVLTPMFGSTNLERLPVLAGS
jgi:hypothetical protein